MSRTGRDGGSQQVGWDREGALGCLHEPPERPWLGAVYRPGGRPGLEIPVAAPRAGRMRPLGQSRAGVPCSKEHRRSMSGKTGPFLLLCLYLDA